MQSLHNGSSTPQPQDGHNSNGLSMANHSNELNTHNHANGDSHYQNGFNKANDSKLTSYLNNSSINKNSISSVNSDHNTSNGNSGNGSNSVGGNGLYASNGTSLGHGSNSANGSNNQQSENNNENHSNNNDQIPSKLMSSQPQFTSGQKDILRLIGQHLRYLGLNKTTEVLINESGCMLEHPTAANFCNLIMGGHWDEVVLIETN
jgi:hypothetical protein